MNRDLMICKRIMLQLAQNGHVVSETPEEAYHVALLVDRGYVTATIDKDACGTPVKATVGRMTAIGHDALEAEFSSAPVSSQPIIAPEKYYEMLTKLKSQNEAARDKMLAMIASCGIGLLFGIASYLQTNAKTFPRLPWLTTLILWGLVLIGLLISDHVGSKAMNEAIKQLAGNKTDVMQKHTEMDIISQVCNIVNCVAAILGIGAFAWFVWTIV